MTHPLQLVLGVDSYKDGHVAVLLDRLGCWLATASFGTTDAANTELVAWTHRYGHRPRRTGRIGTWHKDRLDIRPGRGQPRPLARPGPRARPGRLDAAAGGRLVVVDLHPLYDRSTGSIRSRRAVLCRRGPAVLRPP
jgi:hypothetical protein